MKLPDWLETDSGIPFHGVRYRDNMRWSVVRENGRTMVIARALLWWETTLALLVLAIGGAVVVYFVLKGSAPVVVPVIVVLLVIFVCIAYLLHVRTGRRYAANGGPPVVLDSAAGTLFLRDEQVTVRVSDIDSIQFLSADGGGLWRAELNVVTKGSDSRQYGLICHSCAGEIRSVGEKLASAIGVPLHVIEKSMWGKKREYLWQEGQTFGP